VLEVRIGGIARGANPIRSPVIRAAGVDDVQLPRVVVFTRASEFGTWAK